MFIPGRIVWVEQFVNLNWYEIFPWTSSISAEVVGESVEDMLAMADTYIEIGQIRMAYDHS